MAVNNLSPHAIRELISRYEVELHKLQFQLERTEQTIEELRQAIPQAEQREAGKRRAKLNGGSREREAAEETPSETAAPSDAAESGAPAGRGDTAMEAGAEDQASPKRRGRRAGRPAKAAAAPKTEAPPAATEAPAATEEKPRRRGRPKGTTSKAKAKPTAKAKPGRKKASAKDRSSGYRLSKYDELILQALDDRNKVLITTELQDFVEEQMRNEGQPVDPEDVRLRISRSLQKLVNRRKDLIKVPYGGRGFAYGRQNWFNKEGDLKSKYGR